LLVLLLLLLLNSGLKRPDCASSRLF